MREIKFRGKRTDNGEWAYGYYVVDPLQRHRIYLPPFPECTTNTFYFVDPETVGQYTGFKDVDGKEVYEWDIINSDSHNPRRYKVAYIEGGFCAMDGIWPIELNHFYPSIGCEIEVIGNIHDNPNLLTP